MEPNINNIGVQITGIAWEIKNVTVDKLRELNEGSFYVSKDVLEEIIKQLTDVADELDFIGNILADGTNDK